MITPGWLSISKIYWNLCNLTWVCTTPVRAQISVVSFLTIQPWQLQTVTPNEREAGRWHFLKVLWTWSDRPRRNGLKSCQGRYRYQEKNLSTERVVKPGNRLLQWWGHHPWIDLKDVAPGDMNAGVLAGLDDLWVLFQPKQFCDTPRLLLTGMWQMFNYEKSMGYWRVT